MELIQLILMLIILCPHSFQEKVKKGITFTLHKTNYHVERNLMLKEDITTHVDTSILHGNATELFYYFVDIYIGNPPKKQTLIVDTASGNTGVPCQEYCQNCGKHLNSYYNPKNSKNSRVIQCSDSDCGVFNPKKICIEDRHCNYTWKYGEGSMYQGYVFEDSFLFGNNYHPIDSFKMLFGCHTNETKYFYTQQVDGILGVSPSQQKNNFIFNLYDSKVIGKNMFSLCLAKNGGFFTVGGTNSIYHSTNSTVTYIPYIPSDYYHIDINAIYIGKNQTSSKRETTFKAFIDSGTTLSYFPIDVYKEFIKDFDRNFDVFCKSKNSTKCDSIQSESSTSTESTKCFKVPLKMNKTEFFDLFPSIIFKFGNNAYYEWIPSNYLYLSYTYGFYGQEVFCLGISPTKSTKINLGSTWMQNQDVIFDRENNRIGIIPSFCSGDARLMRGDDDNSLGEVINLNRKDSSHSIIIIIVALIGLSLLITIIYAIHYTLKQYRNRVLIPVDTTGASIDLTGMNNDFAYSRSRG